jgi:hypothetical protein
MIAHSLGFMLTLQIIFSVASLVSDVGLTLFYQNPLLRHDNI